MKRKISILLVLTLLACLLVPSAMAQNIVDLKGKLVILHTNDIHGYAVTNPSEPTMGYAQIAEYRKEALDQGANVLMLDAGDFSQGQPIVNLDQGASAVEFMNAVGYDAACPGNHEYDWGSDNFLQNAEKANFPILAANIIRSSDKELIFQANKIFEYGDVKVGVFGLDTPETLTKANPELMKGLTFLMGEELYACAQAQVDELKAAGCTLIVCLGHMGVDDESIGNRSLDIIANTNGIDLFIDGHSHTELNQKVDQKAVEGEEKAAQTLLVSTGSYGHNLGEVVYDGESLSAALVPASPAQITANEGDDEVADAVNSKNAAVEEQLSAVFAKTEVDLDGNRDPGVRTQETNLGDFCTDAMLWAANQSYSQPVVAAINNGGGIRASIAAGDMTMKDMKTVFPYGNTVAVLTLKGSELLEALESATFATPDALGAFPQVSGIVFTIDTSVAYEQGDQYPDSTYYAPAKPGSRVTIESVGGEPFDLEKDYVIATNNFSAAGGDTYYVFAYAYKQTGTDLGVALEDALINYVNVQLGGVIGQEYAQPQGRITVK
ncbi:MAG: bifunctional UDP-sugar hydrolase/5'-nucleotidase [Eubacteriales bacterium]|nr:bifunctional UDP-sugar hydrolase/5'-nucleotidase [Eubacteriales bacterium]